MSESKVSFCLKFVEFKQAISTVSTLVGLSGLAQDPDHLVAQVSVDETEATFLVTDGTLLASVKVALEKPTEERGSFNIALNLLGRQTSSAKEISFTSDGQKLHIVSGRTKTKLPLSSIETVSPPSDVPDLVELHPSSLTTAGQAVDFSSVLDGHSDFFLTLKAGKLSCWAHNSWHAGLYTEQVTTVQTPELSGVCNAKVLQRFAVASKESMVSVGFSPTHWELASERARFIHPLKAVDISNIEEGFGSLDMTGVPVIRILAKDLIEDLTSVTSFDKSVQEKTSAVLISLSKDSTDLSLAASSESGSSKADLPCKTVTNVTTDLRVALNYRALLDFLSRFRKGSDVDVYFHADRLVLASVDMSTRFMLALVDIESLPPSLD